MNAIAALLERPIFQALGWTLIHFIWQGALIGFLYFSLSLVLRRRSPNTRYAAACLAMLLMMIAPAVTFVKVRATVDDRPVTVSTTDWTAPEIEPVAVKHPPISSTALASSNEISPQAATPETLMNRIRDDLPRFMPGLL